MSSMCQMGMHSVMVLVLKAWCLVPYEEDVIV